MAKYTAADVTKLALPANFNESLLVRCLEHDFGKSKTSNSPMITCQWEVVGILIDDEVHTKLEQSGEEYIIGGLRTNKTYHTISKKALSFFQEFWCKSQGIPLDKFEVDDENPDRSHLTGLVMSAVVETSVVPRRKKLTEEQRADMKAAGIPDDQIQGEIILKSDGSGEPETINLYNITRWNEKYNGELPAF